jgi:hypothetical protein
MIKRASVHTFPATSHRIDTAPEATRNFEWTMVILSIWVLGGAYLDAWAHRHVASTLETFFTPWHAVLYSGVLATGTFLFIALLRGREAGRTWRTALPIGYGVSFLGFVLFGIAGNLDLAWHTIFGIERKYAATLSPTHLLLMLSAGLMVTGGLRSAWSSGRRRLSYTGLLSATLFLGLLIFFSQDLHPFTSQWSAVGTPPFLLNDQGEQLGVVEVIVQSAVLMGVVLFLLRRFALPTGALTILLTLTTAAIVVIWKPDPVVLIGTTGGLIGDVLLAALRPGPARPVALRVFAFVLPSSIYLLYFIGILKADGIWWPVHVWTGAVAVAGLTGLLLSFLVVGPGSSQLLREDTPLTSRA